MHIFYQNKLIINNNPTSFVRLFFSIPYYSIDADAHTYIYIYIPKLKNAVINSAFKAL